MKGKSIQPDCLHYILLKESNFLRPLADKAYGHLVAATRNTRVGIGMIIAGGCQLFYQTPM